MATRTVLAFAIAPITAAVVVWLALTALGGREATFYLPFLISAAYVCAALLGAPAHLLLIKSRWNRWWQYTLAGLVIGSLPSVLVLAIPHLQASRAIAILGSLFGCMAGPMGAAVFWAIAVRPRVQHAGV